MSIAISPSSFFASQRVPVTAPDRREFCRSLANSLAKSIKNHGENRSRETPRGTQNRLKIGPGTLSGHPVASKSVPKASRERLGSVSGASRERPRRAAKASGGSPRVPRDARKGALERLGACRGDQNRHQVASGSGKIEFSLRCAFAKHCRSDFSSIFVDFCFFCKVCEPLKVLHLSAKTEVRPFALRVESLARCNLEKPRKSTRKSTRPRRKSPLRASRAPARLSGSSGKAGFSGKSGIPEACRCRHGRSVTNHPG